MRKQATVVHHGGGFFLAINGDLNKREVVLNGFVKGMSTVKQYFKAISKKDGSGFTSYEYADQALVTPEDLTNVNHLSINDIWNPNLNVIDEDTAEVTETPENIREFETEDAPVFITDEQCEEQEINNEEYNKQLNLKNIMETKAINKRKEAAQKGWETRRANLEAAVNEAKSLRKAEAKAFNKLWDEAIIANDKYNQELNDRKILEAEQAIKWAKDNLESNTNNNNNNNNSENMNTNKEASADAPKTKTRRARRTLAKVTETGIVVTTDLLAGTTMLGSDLLYLVAEGFAWSQAAAIKPLGLHPDATRAELKDACIKRAENRSAAVIAAPQMAMALPKRGIASIKQAIAMRNNKGIVDIQNAEVVG